MEALEKRGNESVTSKDRVHVSAWNARGQSAQTSQVTEFKYLGSTLQSDGDMSTEVNKRMQCGWNNWGKMLKERSTR